jgi:hypothetical protein
MPKSSSFNVATAGDEDVVRLHIPVDDALGMGGSESPGNHSP